MAGSGTGTISPWAGFVPDSCPDRPLGLAKMISCNCPGERAESEEPKKSPVQPAAVQPCQLAIVSPPVHVAGLLSANIRMLPPAGPMSIVESPASVSWPERACLAETVHGQCSAAECERRADRQGIVDSQGQRAGVDRRTAEIGIFSTESQRARADFRKRSVAAENCRSIRWPDYCCQPTEPNPSTDSDCLSNHPRLHLRFH